MAVRRGQGASVHRFELLDDGLSLGGKGRFSFEISTRSLCAHDKIRILRDAGISLIEGKSCSLGRFQPVTYEELVERDSKKPPAPQKAEPTDVEDVVTD